MKKLLPILLIGVMLFSIGIVAFASPKVELCSATGGPHETELVYGSNGAWFIWCVNCYDIFDEGIG